MLEPFLSYHRKLVIAEEKVKFLENSDVVFNTVIQLLKKNGIHVWLDFGTLLGAYRDSDFIKMILIWILEHLVLIMIK